MKKQTRDLRNVGYNCKMLIFVKKLVCVSEDGTYTRAACTCRGRNKKEKGNEEEEKRNKEIGLSK